MKYNTLILAAMTLAFFSIEGKAEKAPTSIKCDLACNIATCKDPNMMQSCLQDCKFPEEITNCVSWNLDTAAKVCNRPGGKTGFQKDNCDKLAVSCRK